MSMFELTTLGVLDPVLLSKLERFRSTSIPSSQHDQEDRL